MYLNHFSSILGTSPFTSHSLAADFHASSLVSTSWWGLGNGSSKRQLSSQSIWDFSTIALLGPVSSSFSFLPSSRQGSWVSDWESSSSEDSCSVLLTPPLLLETSSH